MIFTEAGKELYKAMLIPSDWEVYKCHVKHIPTGICMWTSNGAMFFDGDDIRDTPPFLGLIERFILWPRMKKIINKITPNRKHMNTKFAVALRTKYKIID